MSAQIGRKQCSNLNSLTTDRNMAGSGHKKRENDWKDSLFSRFDNILFLFTFPLYTITETSGFSLIDRDSFSAYNEIRSREKTEKTGGHPMKYTLYRSFGNLDNDVRKHELAAVEYAPDIYAATDALVRAVADDLAGMPEYAGCETTSFAPEPVQPYRKVKRYSYVMTGQVIPPNAPENILIEYGVVEGNE